MVFMKFICLILFLFFNTLHSMQNEQMIEKIFPNYFLNELKSILLKQENKSLLHCSFETMNNKELYKLGIEYLHGILDRVIQDIQDKFSLNKFILIKLKSNDESLSAIVVQLILMNGAFLNFKDDDGGMNYLHYVAKYNRIDLAVLFLYLAIDINSLDNFSCTPLHYAAQNGHYEMVQFLVINGANKDLVDLCNQDAADYAWMRGYKDIAKLLGYSKDIDDYSLNCVIL
ncbi:hypothetical protein GF322_01795 [Candidatus Dependentiae bacterium]|nr:hypothetical protein [Candidatus Dependentiae bacterium]